MCHTHPQPHELNATSSQFYCRLRRALSEVSSNHQAERIMQTVHCVFAMLLHMFVNYYLCDCIVFSTTLASAAGIGGGGLTLPVLIIIFGFSFHKSVVLSLCSVLGNTLLQVTINASLRHPQEISRPLIYWDAIL